MGKEANSIPELFQSMEDFGECGVVCKELDLAGTIKEDIVV
jgi:hypothetical protein